MLDKAIKQPWKKIMEKVRRKPQPNAGSKSMLFSVPLPDNWRLLFQVERQHVDMMLTFEPLDDAENDVQKDIGRTSDVHIKYVDGLRLRGSKRRV